MSHARRWKYFLFILGVFLFPSFSHASSMVEPDDTFFRKQWYLDSIHAQEGWKVTTGSSDVIVAVIDSGVDIDHPDLRSHVWVNPREIPNNQKDDDGDGYVDDVRGWNFISHSADVNPIPSTDGVSEAWIHGTAVASLIAATGNDHFGIAGVTWNARIMPLVVLGPNGYGRDEDIIRAIRYAVVHGADVINLSLVSYEFDADLADAIHQATAQGVLVVSAAGNSEKDGGQDMDLLPGFPACDKGVLGLGQLTVTALTREKIKASRANFGSCVDVSAPGSDIFAARPTYTPFHEGVAAGYMDGLSGTSVAAPLVSGLAAALKAAHPSWRAPELAKRIMDTSDPVSEPLSAPWRGKIGHGQINVAKALAPDSSSFRFGPLFLEAGETGVPPFVRVRTENGDEVARFLVAERGDRRGVRAAFVRWDGALEPNIAITMKGDPTGAWRIYRMDGVLLAAGSLGKDIVGGLTLAAEDANGNGKDSLLFSENRGRRAWFVSSDMSTPRLLTPWNGSLVGGAVAVSVTRPRPSFLLSSISGNRDVVVIGKDANQLAKGFLGSPENGALRTLRYGEERHGNPVYDIQASSSHLILTSDANGVHRTDQAFEVMRWIQIPQGAPSDPGWVYFESWPR